MPPRSWMPFMGTPGSSCWGGGRLGSRQHGDTDHRVACHQFGKLVFAERVKITGDIQSLLDRPTIGAGARAIATMLYVAPDAEARLEEVRELLAPDDSAPVEWGASAWNGLLCIRAVSPEASALRRQTARFLNRFRQLPLPRVWQC